MTTEQERASALAAFMRDEAQKVDAGHRAEEKLRLQSSGRRHGVLTLSLVIAVYVWFFPPGMGPGESSPPRSHGSGGGIRPTHDDVRSGSAH